MALQVSLIICAPVFCYNTCEYTNLRRYVEAAKEHASLTGNYPQGQARRQDLAEGGHILKILYWMYAAKPGGRT